MFGLTFEKLLLIGLIGVLLIGPDRLPAAAAGFARFIRALRDFANGAKTRVKDELGPEYDDIDWKKLDPRQYDPRRIIREALLDEPAAPAPTYGNAATTTGGTSPVPERQTARRDFSATTPFDGEST